MDEYVVGLELVFKLSKLSNIESESIDPVNFDEVGNEDDEEEF